MGRPSCGTGFQPVIQTGKMPAPYNRKAIRRAIMAKEWHEQRWRFALGTLVLSGILAGLLRAQVIPFSEATLLVYWIVGVILAIFLAMGPVSMEKADRTWDFLLAQPISRADVLLAKWRVVLLQFVGIILIATTAGGLAMWSRGFQGTESLVPEWVQSDELSETEVEGRWVRRSELDDGYERLSAFKAYLAERGERLPPRLLLRYWISTLGYWAMSPLAHPLGSLVVISLVSTVTLSCWLTLLFFILSRARNEFTAALGGILLTIVLHVWLWISVGVWLLPTHELVSIPATPLVRVPASINPLLPLAMVFAREYQAWLPVALIADIALWIAVPVWIVRRCGRRASCR
jgi:hypothetical protein